MKNIRGKRGKKAVSPIIATILLVAFVVVIAAIVWGFFGQFIRENILKQEKTVEALCADSVKISASVDLRNSKVLIENNGDIPLAGFFLKLSKRGEAKQIYFPCTIEQGKTTTCQGLDLVQFGTLTTSCEKAEVIPVLLGVGTRGKYKLAGCDQQIQSFKCSEL